MYVDHPVHAPYGHTVNIDVLSPGQGPSARVALELTEESALALAAAIHRAIDSAPTGLASQGPVATTPLAPSCHGSLRGPGAAA